VPVRRASKSGDPIATAPMAHLADLVARLNPPPRQRPRAASGAGMAIAR